MDMVVSPHALVESGGALRLNGHYYISRQIIPALERVLSLVRGLLYGWAATWSKHHGSAPDAGAAVAPTS